VNCPECKTKTKKYHVHGMLVHYCNKCDSFWDMDIKMKYPKSSYLHAYGKLGIAWLEFTSAIKKEITKIWRR